MSDRFLKLGDEILTAPQLVTKYRVMKAVPIRAAIYLSVLASNHRCVLKYENKDAKCKLVALAVASNLQLLTLTLLGSAGYLGGGHYSCL